MIINNNKALPVARTQRMIYSIEDYLNPIEPSLADSFSSSFDRYSDNGQIFSIMHTNEGDDRCETLHLNKDLVFSVDAQRQFSNPIKLSVLQKGYVRFIFVWAGEVDIEGPDNKTYALRPQHGFIARYGNAPVLYTICKPQTFSAVSLIASPEALRMLIGIPAEKLPSAFDNILNTSSCDTFSATFNLDQKVLQLLVDMIKPTSDSVEFRQLYLKSKLLELIYSVVQQFHYQEQPKTPLTLSCQSSVIPGLNRVRELIESRIYDPPGTYELCELAGSNRSKLIAQFKQNFGLTPYQYGLEKRFQRARQLLEEGGYSVADVANQVGYREISSFSRGFRLHFGLTPSQVLKAS